MREAVSVCWVQVRTFLQLPVVNAVDSHTPATLARLVEGWTFHETLLEHGKQVHTCLHELRSWWTAQTNHVADRFRKLVSVQPVCLQMRRITIEEVL